MTLDPAGLSELIGTQDGLLTRRQASSSGLTRSALQHRVRSGGAWQVVLPGVYATFTGDLTAHQRWMAALLYGGKASLLGGPTAATLYGLRQLPRSRTVHLLLPHSAHRASRGFVEVRRTIAMPAPRFFDEMQAVPIERAVVDACRVLRDKDQVRALVAEAVQRRKTNVAALRTEMARGGSAGSALIRQVLDEIAEGAHSVAEVVGHDLVRRSRLPPAEWNRQLFTAQGEWLACPDAWWRDAGVVLEIDSQEWHLLPEHWAATMRRHARMTSYGLLVVHVTPRQLRTQPDDVLETLGRTIAQGLARPTPPVTDVPPPGWRPWSARSA